MKEKLSLVTMFKKNKKIEVKPYSVIYLLKHRVNNQI